MKTLLIVENEEKLVTLMIPYFKEEGYHVFHTPKGSEALFMLSQKHVDAVILDVMLDDLDGWRVLKDIKSLYDIPVMMLTARSDEADTLFGYDLGANDYMTKPFSIKELVIRVNKMKDNKKNTSHISFQFRKDFYEVIIMNAVIRLSKTEHDLLSYFMDHQNEVISRDTLLNQVWGYVYMGDSRVVDTTVKRLRKKIYPFEYIQTIFGVGYKMVIPS
jgi:two-component system, OmpR family, response regulator ResD